MRLYSCNFSLLFVGRGEGGSWAPLRDASDVRRGGGGGRGGGGAEGDDDVGEFLHRSRVEESCAYCIYRCARAAADEVEGAAAEARTNDERYGAAVAEEYSPSTAYYSV